MSDKDKTMSDDLAERLRDRRVCSLAQNSCRNDWICEQAADRIEEPEAKLEEAEWLLVGAAVQLEEGKIKTRRNHAALVKHFLTELKDTNNQTARKEIPMSKDEQAIEAEIQEKGLTAKRITPDMLDEEIVREQFHVFDGSCLTVCCLTMKNGFTVTGESACASPENFNAEIGQKIARSNAREKLWPLLGFRLRDLLSE